MNRMSRGQELWKQKQKQSNAQEHELREETPSPTSASRFLKRKKEIVERKSPKKPRVANQEEEATMQIDDEKWAARKTIFEKMGAKMERGFSEQGGELPEFISTLIATHG